MSANNVVFYAMGPQCWGKGRTLKEAINNARENFPRFYTGIKRKLPTDKCFSAWEIARTDGNKLAYSEISVSDIDGGFSAPKDCTVRKLQTSTLAKAVRS